jgi:hypothetical protein
MPALSRADIIRAYDIFGQPLEYVREKLNKKKVSRVMFDEALRNKESQTFWADVMHIDQKTFFMSVAQPMQLIMLNYIMSEDAESLGEALQDQLSLLRERNFQPQLVYVDPASGLMSLRTQFPGVVIDLCGAGDHVSKVDIRICRLKEMYRTVKAGLSWALPKSRVKDFMFYCVSRMNIWRKSALDGTVCPRVLFTGLKPSYRKELSLAFGDYVEVHAGTDNTSRERLVPCKALYPIGNSTGTWQFWNLRTKRYMRHSTWVHMRESVLITDIINNIAEEERGSEELEDEPFKNAVVEDEVPEVVAPVEEITTTDQINPESMIAEEKVGGEKEETQEIPDTGGQASRRSARIAAGAK